MPSDLAKPSKCLRAVGATVRLMFFAVFLSLPVISYLQRDNSAVAIACFLACTFAGVILESWPVIGTLLGVACGFVFQPLIGSGTLESQAWDRFGVYVFWTVLGVGAGFTIDSAKRRNLGSQANRADGNSAEILLQHDDPPMSG